MGDILYRRKMKDSSSIPLKNEVLENGSLVLTIPTSKPFVPAGTKAKGGAGAGSSSLSDTDSTSSGLGHGSLSPAPDPVGLGSPSPTLTPLMYEFEISQDIVGRLIGKQGTYIKQVKTKSGANVQIRQHYAQEHMKICFIEGTHAEIEAALGIIRKRFPPNDYPGFSLSPINQALVSKFPAFALPLPLPILAFPTAPFIPATAKLSLIEGVLNDVRVSAFRNSIQLSLQQPTHPTFPGFTKLQNTLSKFYKNNIDAPGLLKPFSPGVICIAPTISGSWVRAEVAGLISDDACIIRHLDTGKVIQVSVPELRQIRYDFLALPFQSIDCKLYAIQTKRNSCTKHLEDYMRPFFSQTLQASVIGYDFVGTPLVQLYRMGDNQIPVLVNQELVDLGLARFDNGPEGFLEEEERHTDAYVAYHTKELAARRAAKLKSRTRTFSTPVQITLAQTHDDTDHSQDSPPPTSSTPDTEPESIPSPAPSH